MKRFTIIWAMVATLLLPLQAQNRYLYVKDANPIILDKENFYINELKDKYYFTEHQGGQLDAIAGEYTFESMNLFTNETDTWSVEFTRDSEDTTKVWIHPFCYFADLKASRILPIYGIYDETAKTLNVPLGQPLYGGPNSTNHIVLANLDQQITGELCFYYDDSGEDVVLELSDYFGLGDINLDQWWYAVYGSLKCTRVCPYLENPGIFYPLSEIDSVSVNKPMLELQNYEVDNLYVNLYFNHDILTKYQKRDPSYNYQGWFNQLISYKAYNDSNELVIEDYVDIYSIYNNVAQIMMIGFSWLEDQYAAAYVYDDFLPCDTALKVAFSIAPEAIAWSSDTTIVYSGIDSYVSPDGTQQGIVIDYYNERPRLLSTAPLSTALESPYSVMLHFSEPVNTIYVDNRDTITYQVYREVDDEYNLVQTGTDRCLSTDGSEYAFINIPEEVNLQDGDIVTISYDNWFVRDNNYARAAPASMESSVDANGIAQGLYWTVDIRPYIVNLGYNIVCSEDFRTAYVEFNTEIVRTPDMGNISCNIYTYDNEIGGFKLVQTETIVDAVADGSNLAVTLPAEITFNEEVMYVVVLSFEEGAVVDTNGKPMRAVTGIITEDANVTGPWWKVYIEKPQDPTPPDTDSFFVDGGRYAYFLEVDLGDGNYQQVGTDFMELSYVQDYEDESGTVYKYWTLPSPLHIFGNNPEENGITPNDEMPILTYKVDVDGQTLDFLSVNTFDDYPVLGQVTLADSSVVDVYPGMYVEDEGVYIGWDFAVYEFAAADGTTLPGLVYYGVGEPLMFYIDGEYAVPVAMINPETFQIHREDLITMNLGFKKLNRPNRANMKNIQTQDRIIMVKDVKLNK